MELVDGPSLASLVAVEGPLPHGRAARIGLQVLTALEAAHLVGVVHRDVKPANVLMLEGDRAKLTDFGVATIRDESRVTMTGLIVGSPSYMAPEQATGAEITPATDLWALGAMLYFAVEAEPPFHGGSAIATASAVVHGEPRPPQRPGPLSPLLERLFSKDPAGRPTAGAVRATLTRVGDSERSSSASTLVAPAVPAGGPAPVDRSSAGRRAAPDPIPAGRAVVEAAAEPAAVAEPAGDRPAGRPEPEPAEPDPEPDATVDPSPTGGRRRAADRASDRRLGHTGQRRRPVHAGPRPRPHPPGAAAPPPATASARPAARTAFSAGRPRGGGVALLLLVVGVAALTGDDDDGETAGDGDPAPTTSVESDHGQRPTATPRPVAETTTTTPPPPTTAPWFPAGWTPFADPSGAYSIGVPPGWEVRPVTANRIDFRDPSTGSFVRAEWTGEPGADVAGTWRADEPGFAARNANYQQIGITEVAYRDYPAALWEFRHGSGEGLHTGNLGFVANGSRLRPHAAHPREPVGRHAAGVRAVQAGLPAHLTPQAPGAAAAVSPSAPSGPRTRRR